MMVILVQKGIIMIISTYLILHHKYADGIFIALNNAAAKEYNVGILNLPNGR